MFCKHCGKVYPSFSKFCTHCGAANENYLNDNNDIVLEDKNADRGPFKVFAIIGFVVGVISICFSWVPVLPFFTCWVGIVFSFLGIFSKRKKVFAIIGLSLSIIAVVIGIIAFIYYIQESSSNQIVFN